MSSPLVSWFDQLKQKASNGLDSVVQPMQQAAHKGAQSVEGALGIPLAPEPPKNEADPQMVRDANQTYRDAATKRTLPARK